MQSYRFENVYIKSVSAVAGPKEKDGPCGKLFDKTYTSLYAEKKTLEEGEKIMQEDAINIALIKAGLDIKGPELLISADLNNQLACSSKVASSYISSFLGIYSACASSAEGVILASLLLERSNIKNALISSTSSFGTAERQFRYPLEYGIPKKQTTTLTVTGSGSMVLGKKTTDLKITEATLGKVFDPGWKDVNDMGGAMSFAAYKTLKSHFENLGTKPSDYDLIITGDLSIIGSNILLDLFKEEGIEFKNHNDAGKIIYQREKQKAFCGGSGIACLPLVAYTKIYEKLKKKEYRKVLLAATGALFDPVYVQQKQSIPAICHCYTIERG